MSMTALFLILAALQVKHLLADYVFQSAWMVRNKGRYAHPGGLAHSGLHSALTVLVLLFTPLGLGAVLLIALGEFVIHYHMDWAKDAVLKRSTATPKDWAYWVITGLDQFVHQLTLLGIALAAVLLA